MLQEVLSESFVQSCWRIWHALSGLDDINTNTVLLDIYSIVIFSQVEHLSRSLLGFGFI